MTEYALNRLAPNQLAELAYQSATLIAVVTRPSVKLELYYLKGHFIEISYGLKKPTELTAQWRVYSVNHYPDTPSSTKYLTIYLHEIKVQID